jgi:hydrogenase expression/formation protein HypC
MCLAIPMRVVSAEGATARCVGRNGAAELDTLLTGPLRPGDWVLSFLGSAREVVSAEEAARVDAALDALEAAMLGDASLVEAGFADLVGREPELPEFLRKPSPTPPR